MSLFQPIMATDLTRITTPFGLLNEKIQSALKSYYKAGGEIEYYVGHMWNHTTDPRWSASTTYRASLGPVSKDHLKNKIIFLVSKLQEAKTIVRSIEDEIVDTLGEVGDDEAVIREILEIGRIKNLY